MKKVWNETMLERLKAEYPTADLNKLAQELNVTRSAVRCKAKILKVKRSESAKVWTTEKKQLLAELYPNLSNAEIAEILKVSESAINIQAFHQRLLKTPEFHRTRSAKGHFPKGHIPENKGKKWSEFMSEKGQQNSRKTTFSKGHTPLNHRPIGSTRIDVDGYLYEKTAEPKLWVLKHRLVWVAENGPIPKGFNVQFKDKNRLNCDIENLYLISRNEQIANNSIVRYPSELRTAIKRVSKINKLIKQYEHN